MLQTALQNRKKILKLSQVLSE